MHVILVSGWGKPDLMWRQYRNWFHQEGITTSLLQTRYQNFGPIQAAAKQLARQVDDLKYSPVLIGHSSGGLVIRYYMARYHPQSQTGVAGVATLASPLYGTGLARLAPWSASACQMVPGSGFLNSLDVYQDPDVPWLSVRCSRDRLVAGPSSLLDADQAIHLEVPYGHNTVLFSREVWKDLHAHVIDCVTGTFDLIEEEVGDTADDDD